VQDDIVLLRHGDQVPADGTVVRGDRSWTRAAYRRERIG
jgi:cation transport ATPase